MARKTLDGNKEYFKWDKVGQSVEGVFRKMSTTRGTIQGQMVHLEDSEGKQFMVSAPTTLAEMIMDNLAALQDQVITITYVKQEEPKKRGHTGLKRFTIEFDDDDAEG